MSANHLFTEAEWKLIVTAAPMVGIAIAAASPSGPYGIMKEMMSVSMAVQELIAKGSRNALVSALIEDYKEHRTRPDGPLMKSTTPDDAQKLALSHLRSLTEMLYRKSLAESDVDEFKRWLVTIAERVAEAAAEGGFLGFGGQRVSDEERAMIRKITFTLGLPTKPLQE